MRRLLQQLIFSLVVLFWAGLVPSIAAAKASPPASEERKVLNDSDAAGKTFPSEPFSLDRLYRLALGVSYTGVQGRYQFSRRYAMEARVQFGEASSTMGDVNSSVFGLRGYRFIPYRRHVAWYLGAEIAHVEAKAHYSNYATNGFAIGGFGGVEYRILPRLAIGADIGPYVISLKEKQSNLTQTNLDFVVNTALNFYLF